MQPWPRENSFASPATDGGDSVYYTVDATRLTFAEIWRIASPSYLAFLFAAARKIFRRRWRPLFGYAFESPRIADVSDVPERVMHALSDVMADCQKQGFVPRFATTGPAIGDQEGYNVVHANRERTILAMTAYARLGTIKEVVVALVSAYQGGVVVSTTSTKQRLNAPPGVLAVHRVGATLSELHALHGQRLSEITNARPLALDDVAQRQLMLDNVQKNFDFQRARGVYAPISQADTQRLKAQTPAAR